MASGDSLARHRMMMVAPIIVMVKEYDGIGALLQVSFLSKMQVSLSTTWLVVHGSILQSKTAIKLKDSTILIFLFDYVFLKKNVKNLNPFECPLRFGPPELKGKDSSPKKLNTKPSPFVRTFRSQDTTNLQPFKKPSGPAGVLRQGSRIDFCPSKAESLNAFWTPTDSLQ